jgi:hypothetical protein
VERALKCPSCQRLARVGGRARFALLTPTSASHGRADSDAPKFICGSATDIGSGLRIFLTLTRKPAVILRVEAKWVGLLELLLLPWRWWWQVPTVANPSCGGDDVEYSEHEFFPSIVLSQECCGPSSGQGLLAS